MNNCQQEQKALELRRKHERAWRKKNREKIREYERNYWLRKAAASERKTASEVRREYKRAWREKNRDKIREYDRNYGRMRRAAASEIMKGEKPMMNYICINNHKTALTEQQLKELGFATPKTFATASLLEILDIVRRGDARSHFNIHDTKKIEKYDLEIIGIDQDKSVYDPLAPTLTLMAKQVIGLGRMFNDTPSDLGWYDSDLRKWLNEKYIEELPADLVAATSRAMKNVYDSNGNIHDEISDRLFIPSESELFGSSIFSAYEEGPRYEAFATSEDRKRFDSDGDTVWYWTRSQHAGYSSSFVIVTASGPVSSYSATKRYAIPLCLMLS